MPHIWRPSIDNMTRVDQLHTIVDNSSIISRVIFTCARRSWFFFIICTNIEMLTYKCKFGYAIKDFDLDRYLVYELYWHGKKKWDQYHNFYKFSGKHKILQGSNLSTCFITFQQSLWTSTFTFLYHAPFCYILS